jgi:hypothetical protein
MAYNCNLCLDQYVDGFSAWVSYTCQICSGIFGVRIFGWLRIVVLG